MSTSRRVTRSQSSQSLVGQHELDKLEEAKKIVGRLTKADVENLNRILKFPGFRFADDGEPVFGRLTVQKLLYIMVGAADQQGMADSSSIPILRTTEAFSAVLKAYRDQGPQGLAQGDFWAHATTELKSRGGSHWEQCTPGHLRRLVTIYTKAMVAQLHCLAPPQLGDVNEDIKAKYFSPIRSTTYTPQADMGPPIATHDIIMTKHTGNIH